MERMLNTLYVQGYTAALQDVIKVFDNIQDDLKRHKVRRDYKTYKDLFACMIENRAVLRDIPGAFIRYNGKLKKFEVYVEREGVYNPKTGAIEHRIKNKGG